MFVLFVNVILFTMFPSDDSRREEVADAAIREQVLAEILQNQPAQDEFSAIYGRHPANMVYVWPGPYVSGRMRTDLNAVSSEPIANRRETGGYLIDMFEYPNLQGSPPKFAVTQKRPRSCARRPESACARPEVGRTCKGQKSQNYAYGNAWDPEFCGSGLNDAYPSGQVERCKSGYGAYDGRGTSREWTSTETKPGRVVVKGRQKGQPEGYPVPTPRSRARPTPIRRCRSGAASTWHPPTAAVGRGAPAHDPRQRVRGAARPARQRCAASTWQATG
ncbi:MAG: hypothetical protein R3F59_15795 [Myxococcota bacterium]